MLDWCPVCEKAIQLPTHTVTVPIPAPDAATVTDKTPTPAPVAPKVTTKAGGRRPALNRANSKGATTKRGAAKADQQPQQQQNKAEATATSAEEPVAPATKTKTVVSRGPTPLYCSEKCRLEDEAASHALSQTSIWDWTMNHYGVPPFAYPSAYGGREPLPILGTSPASQPATHGFGSTASTTTTVTSTDSIPSVADLYDDASRRRPGFLQMTTLPATSSQSGGATEVSSSAPATTDIASHPPNAILADMGHNAPRGLPLERWQAPTTGVQGPQRTNGQSAVDLYSAAYPLAFAPTRPMMYSRRPSRNPSRKPTPTLWDDVTPTQSLLIPSNGHVRKDDSLEVKMASRHSDSGSSGRSGSTTSRRQRTRSRSQRGFHASFTFVNQSVLNPFSSSHVQIGLRRESHASKPLGHPLLVHDHPDPDQEVSTALHHYTVPVPSEILANTSRLLGSSLAIH